MRRYDIVSGVLFILSIIGFALAAPVLVQEKRQAYGDVMHIPSDVITVLRKRVNPELQRLADQYFERIKAAVKPVESTDVHEPSNSAPPGPDHVSTNLVHAPTQKPEPSASTPNPNPLVEPLSPSSTASSAQSDSDLEEYEWSLHDGADEFHTILDSSSGYGLQHGLTEAHAPLPNPNKRPLTNPDSGFNEEDPPPKRPALSNELGQANEYQVEHAHQLDLGPSTGLPTEPALEVPVVHPPTGSGGMPGPTELAAAHEAVTPPPTNQGSSNEPDNEVAQGPPGSPEMTDAEAARYAVKGKAKLVERE